VIISLLINSAVAFVDGFLVGRALPIIMDVIDLLVVKLTFSAPLTHRTNATSEFGIRPLAAK